MKIVGLNYLTVEELIDDINDADFANELVSALPNVHGFTALLRVTDVTAKTLLKSPAGKRADDTTGDMFR